MFVAYVIVSSLLAAALAYTAARKLTHAPDVVADYARAGVPERWLTPLALLLLAAAAGLIIAIAWAPLGLITSGALAAYFAVAIGFHLRNGDARHAGTPVVLALLSIAAGTLNLVSR
ncbi:DoxX family protein [Agromyces sp. SYSU K20354]|uniref:DoxX family protein n=1 Tax=Agromyces cavernae TaxID=2898659 RepID=UPI001E634B79|nr:DoxX family protein [Agromyces cavernae]MCD2442847.1 DoxX family protein [Agromyces cavernae]